MGNGVPETSRRLPSTLVKPATGDYHACGNLGGMYLRSDGPPDIAKARSLFTKACSGGVERACAFIKRLQQSQPRLPGRP